ncbi:MAG: tyrosine-type recombinase/integrase [Lachnospiraceae bacterium]
MRKITDKLIKKFKEYLYEEEKSTATASKYICDLKKLAKYTGSQELTKKLIINYKEYLQNSGKYKTGSINSFIVAANCFFKFMGWEDLKVKTIKVQKKTFVPDNRDLSKEEYKKLVMAAEKAGKIKLAMIIQTLCAIGLRISELASVTVQSVNSGTVTVYCKGKERQILIPRQLQVKLLYYIHKNQTKNGVVFCTRNGKPIDRSNIWREMKSLCKEAGVEAEKVFPHNLRHLFAKTFYNTCNDIAKLADILGHSSIETTRIYIMTTSREYQKQLDIMGLSVGNWGMPGKRDKIRHKKITT